MKWIIADIGSSFANLKEKQIMIKRTKNDFTSFPYVPNITIMHAILSTLCNSYLIYFCLYIRVGHDMCKT